MMLNRNVFFYLLALLMLVVAAPANGQYRYSFESEDLSEWSQSAPARWDTSALTPIAGTHSLGHVFDNSVGGTDVLCRYFGDWQPDSATTLWQWQLRHGYDPSSSNRWLAWLVADRDIAVNGNYTLANGFAIGVNAAGSADLLELYRMVNGSPTVLASSSVNWQTTVGISAAPLIRVSYLPGGQWAVYFHRNAKADSLLLVASANFATPVQPGYFGFEYRYTATQDMKLWVDDIAIDGLFTIDTLAPMVSSFVTPNGSVLLITLSEEASGDALIRTDNYLLNGNRNPQSVEYLAAERIVRLNFVPGFADGEVQHLIIDSLTDKKGNVRKSTQLQWTYHYRKFHEVLISEVLPDPDPSVDLPLYEFVELSNQSADTIYFDGWNIKLGSRSYALDGLRVPPDSFAILCHSDAKAEYSEFGKAFVALSSLTALTNTGLSIGLYDNDNQLIDTIRYTSAEYTDSEKAAGGWSLERINPDSLCGAGSWKASVNVHGGSPGEANSVYFEPDTVAPVLKSIQLVSDSLLILLFDELPVAESLTVRLNGVMLRAVLMQQSGLSLHCYFNGGTFPADSVLDVSVENSTDACGNVSSASKLLAPYFVPQTGQLLITEIMADPDPSVGLPEAEYLEVQNVVSDTLTLNGCTVVINGVPKPLKGKIAPGGYAIICHDSKAYLFASAENVVAVPAMPSLINSSATIALVNNRQTVIDSLTYHSLWIANAQKREGGWSLERTGAEGRCGTPDWLVSVNVHGGSPGEANSVYFEPDTAAPVLLRASLSADSCIVLDFDDTPVASGLQYLTPDTVIVPLSHTITGCTISMYFSSGTFRQGINHTGQVHGITDVCTNSSMVEVDFPAYYIPQTGQLIINEVLVNPRTGGADFVEIKNLSALSFDLRNLALANPTQEWDNPAALGAEGSYLPANGLLAFADDSAAIGTDFPDACKGQIRQAVDLPSLPDTEGSIGLYYLPTRTLIDRLNYTDDMHSMYLVSREGVSLERAPSESSGQLWYSAAETAGFGTPGCENSTHSEGTAGTLVAIGTEIVSPDGDGYQDVVDICIDTPTPGWIASLDIYTLAGIRVKTIASQVIIAPGNCFVWDGTDGNGSVGASNVYLINIELADPAGKKFQEIKPVTLIRR